MPCTSDAESQEPVRVCICDPFRLFRQALWCLLSHESGFRVVGEAATGQQTLRLCRKLSPDVALIDLQLPGLSGLEVAQSLLTHAPEVRIILLANNVRRSDVLEAVRSGVAAYLPKEAEAELLALTIRQVVKGCILLTPDTVKPLLSRLGQHEKKLPAEPRLTERQQRALQLLAQGAANSEIARVLGVKEKTVRNLLWEVYRLLGVRNRIEAVRYTLQKGWVNLEESS